MTMTIRQFMQKVVDAGISLDTEILFSDIYGDGKFTEIRSVACGSGEMYLIKDKDEDYPETVFKYKELTQGLIDDGFGKDDVFTEKELKEASPCIVLY